MLQVSPGYLDGYNPNFGYLPGGFRKTQNVVKKQYIYNSYKGYVPIPIKDGKQVEVEGKKFELNPYYGFVPAEESKGNETVAEEEEKLVYHHMFGFVTPKELEEEVEKQNKIRYNYHPRYGFVAIPDKSEDEDEAAGEEKEEELFLYHPYHGFVPESKAEDNKMYKGLDKQRKFVYTSHLGYVPTEIANKKYKLDFKKGYVLEAEEAETEADSDDKKEEAEEEKKYIYHPYFGFISKDMLNDDNTLKGVDYEEKYIYNKRFGFVPEAEVTSDEDEKAEKEEVREKRSAQFVYPTYQYSVIPSVIYSSPKEAVAKADFIVPASTNLIQNPVVYIPGIATKQDSETPEVC